MASPSAFSPAKCTTRAFPEPTGAIACARPRRWVSIPSPPTSSGTSTSRSPASTTSLATTMSPSSFAKPSRRASTSTCGRAPTVAPSGTSAVTLRGCSKTIRWLCAATIRSSLQPHRAGCIVSARNSRPCKSAAAVPSSWSRSKTSTAASAATTTTWARSGGSLRTAASAMRSSTPPMARNKCPTAPSRLARRRQLRHRRGETLL
jgi:hypothetical protein